MKNTMKNALIGALLLAAAPFATAEDAKAHAVKCGEIYKEASVAVAKSPAKVLEIIAKMVAANEACAGSVVKAAIVATNANDELVSQIVEAAVSAAPKQASSIAANATAVAPSASGKIAAVVARVTSGTAQGPQKVHPNSFPEGPRGVGQGIPTVGPAAVGPAGGVLTSQGGGVQNAHGLVNTPISASR